MFLTTKGKFLLSVTTCQFVDPPNLLNAAAVEERPLRETAERATGPSPSRPAAPQSGRPTTHFPGLSLCLDKCLRYCGESLLSPSGHGNWKEKE